MDQTLINETLYTLLSNLYPSIHGNIGSYIFSHVFIVASIVLALVAIKTFFRSCKAIYSDVDSDGRLKDGRLQSNAVPNNVIACIISIILSIACIGFSIKCSNWYKVTKFEILSERVKQDKEVRDRIDKMKTDLNWFNDLSIRFK